VLYSEGSEAKQCPKHGATRVSAVNELRFRGDTICSLGPRNGQTHLIHHDYNFKSPCYFVCSCTVSRVFSFFVCVICRRVLVDE
jgi:hypothetical protein